MPLNKSLLAASLAAAATAHFKPKDQAMATNISAEQLAFNKRFENDSHVGWKPFDYWSAGWEAAIAQARSAAPAGQADERTLRDWKSIIHNEELTMGDRLQRISSRISSILVDAAPVSPAGQQADETLKNKLRALVYAASAVVDRWDSPKWKDEPHTAEFIHRLRAAIAEASANSATADPVAGQQAAPAELSKAFMTLESSGGEGRTIVLKFNQRTDAYAVHDFLLKAGSKDYRAAASQAAPVGYKLVPLKCTPEMRAAWDRSPQNEDGDVEFHDAYAAMVNAAPPAPAQQAGEADATASASQSQVGCERADGLLNIHAESETCEVCAPVAAQQAAAKAPAAQAVDARELAANLRILADLLGIFHGGDDDYVVAHSVSTLDQVVREVKALRSLVDDLGTAHAGEAPASIDTLEFHALIGKLLLGAEDLDDDSDYVEALKELIKHIDSRIAPPPVGVKPWEERAAEAGSAYGNHVYYMQQEINDLRNYIRFMPSVPTRGHLDDIAVDEFAAAMKAKMAASRAKGRGGWDDPAQCPTERLQSMLLAHLGKGDPVDIGNFAMMLWNRGERVVSQQAQPPSDQLNPVPDLEAGRLFDEWWASVPRDEMERLAQNGAVQQEFDAWRSKRSTNH